MLGFNKNQENEKIKNPPSDDFCSMIQILFTKNSGISIKTLSLTILDLINKDTLK